MDMEKLWDTNNSNKDIKNYALSPANQAASQVLTDNAAQTTLRVGMKRFQPPSILRGDNNNYDDNSKPDM